MSVVNIITPQSTIISLGRQSIPIRWSGQFDVYQTHYELQYRLKDTSSWSTLGKVASNAKEANLQGIADRVERPFAEVCYRVVVYYDKSMPGDRQTGYEYSNVYMIVYLPPYTSKLQEYDGHGIQTYPLYDTLEDKAIPFVSMQVEEGKTKKLPLLEKNHVLASKATTELPVGTKQFASNVLQTYLPVANGEGYCEHKIQYTTYAYYTIPQYTKYYYRDAVQYYRPSYTVYNGMTTHNDTTKKYGVYYRPVNTNKFDVRYYKATSHGSYPNIYFTHDYGYTYYSNQYYTYYTKYAYYYYGKYYRHNYTTVPASYGFNYEDRYGYKVSHYTYYCYVDRQADYLQKYTYR